MSCSRAAKKLTDVAAVLAVIGAGLICWEPVLPGLREGVIYVSPDGSNWRSGSTPQRAVRTIQYAADLAQPGDTIVILPGTYRERVTIRRGGQPGRPVTFKAHTPGTVLVTGEAEPRVAERLAWRGEGQGVFSTATPWPIYLVKCDGCTLLHLKWHGRELIRKFAARKGAWGMFYYDDGRLYVALPDRGSPAEHRIALHDRVPPPGEWGAMKAANLWVVADHLRIEGLRFDFGVGVAIRLRQALDIRIAECLFTGAGSGVKANRSVKPVTDLRIEHCLFHNYPEREWRREWLTKEETYAFSGTGLCASDGPSAVLRGNLVVHATDGMAVTTKDIPNRGRVEVSENLIAWCTDDAIEFDGFARGVTFHHNLVYDCHESLGISPVLAGPVTIRQNLFLHPLSGLNGAQVKLLSPWLDEGPPLNGPIRNVHIFENTFVGNWLCWYGNCSVEDVRVERNVFAVRRAKEPRWPPGVVESGNVYLKPPPVEVDPAGDPSWFQARHEGSASGDAPRVGAVPADGPWTMQRPGPRWLDWRSLPATTPLLQAISPELFTE